MFQDADARTYLGHRGTTDTPTQCIQYASFCYVGALRSNRRRGRRLSLDQRWTGPGWSACGIGVLLEDVRATSCHHPVEVKQTGDRRLGARRQKDRSDF